MKTSYIKILDILFVVYILSALLTEHSIIGKLGLFAFILAAFVPIVMNKVHINWFVILEMLFIIYCIFQIMFEIPVYADVSMSRVKTMLFCSLFNLALYNYMLYRGEPMKVIELLVKCFVSALSINVVLNLRWLMAGSRGDENAGIEVMGITIGSVNAVSIGWFAGIGLVLSVIVYANRRDIKSCLIYMIIFSLIILLSGTRKMILVVPIAFLIFMMMMSKDRNELFQFIKYAFLVLMLGGILLVLVLKVPILYDTLGHRLENILTYMSTGEDGDSSMITRMRLRVLASNAIKERPIFGWGLDNFKYVFNNGRYYAHNNFLEIGVSGGIIGIILYFSKYVYVYLKLIKSHRTKDIEQRKCTLALLLGISVFVIMEFWQVTYYNRLAAIMFVLVLGFIDSRKTECAVKEQEEMLEE